MTDRQTDRRHRRQTTDRQTNRITLCPMIICLLRRLDNNNEVDVQLQYILVWKLHTQACEIVAGTKRKLCKKFQVDICKTKKDRSAHAQLCTL